MVELDATIVRARQNLAASPADLQWLPERKPPPRPPAGSLVVQPSLFGMSLTGLLVISVFVAFSAGFLRLALLSTGLSP